MRRLTKSIFIVSLSILLILSFIFTGCNSTPSQPEQTPPATTSPGISTEPTKPTSPLPTIPPPAPAPTGAIIVKLSFSEPPVLGKPVQVVATFSLREGYKKDAKNAKLKIGLDYGFELVDGNLTWNGDLLRGSSVEIKAIVKAMKTGENRIGAGGQAFSTDGTAYTGGATVLYVYVSENSAEISDIPIGPKIGHGGPAEPPPGWKLPPGYENITPIAPSSPPVQEPPPQDVTPVS